MILSSPHLPAPQLELWERYCAAESDRVRAVLLPALEVFLDSLKLLRVDEWRGWAYDLCRRLVDESGEFPVRMPLFERALFPALLSGLQLDHAGCARWLSGFSMLLADRPVLREQLRPFGQTEVELLNLALRQDTSDRRARVRLINAMVSELEFSLHEVPSGVLYAGSGATVEQCREMLRDAAALEKLLRMENLEEEYRPLIDACNFHFRRYQEYLVRRELFSDYPQYLEWWEESS